MSDCILPFRLRLSCSGDAPKETVFLLAAKDSWVFGSDRAHRLVSRPAEPLHSHSRKMSVSFDGSSALQAL